jgi:hypothetical protein
MAQVERGNRAAATVASGPDGGSPGLARLRRRVAAEAVGTAVLLAALFRWLVPGVR